MALDKLVAMVPKNLGDFLLAVISMRLLLSDLRSERFDMDRARAERLSGAPELEAS